MRRWRSFPRERKRWILGLCAVVLLAAATSAVALSRGQLLIDNDEVAETGTTKAVALEAPVPPPQAVFLQKSSSFAGRGDVLVSVQLTPAQVSAKVAEGTGSFIAVGGPDSQAILRDDGQQGDAVAGDGLFTGIGTSDPAELSARSSSDAAELAGRGNSTAPVFAGRTLVGSAAQVAFDAAAFDAGQRVQFEPAVVFPEAAPATPIEIQPETSRGPASLATAAVTLGTNLFQDRVLMIRDPAVVADSTRTLNPCNGAGTATGIWTFNHLMTQMANQTASGIDPRDFAEVWLNHWLDTSLTINGDNVTDRQRLLTIINQWRAAGTSGKLELDKAPLRLLAIVSRPDLRRTSGGGGGYGPTASGHFIDAGEARFVFGFVLKPGWSAGNLLGAVQIPGQPAGCRALPFSVIVEYRVPKCGCQEVKSWAKAWVELRNHTPGTAAYNDRLARLTEQFVRANANPGQPNGSALGQLRTNEIALTPQPQFLWELREFQLTQFPFTFLEETTTADSARDAFNNTTTFRDWILLQVAPNLTPPRFQDPIPAVPLIFSGGSFLGAHPQPTTANFFWNAPGLNLSPNNGNNTDNWGRHRAGLAACNGCHARETNTTFVHVDPSDSLGSITSPVRISGFLSGVTVTDPAEVAGKPTREFDDLARREQDIKRLSRISCFRLHPVNLAHVQASLKANGTLPADVFGGSASIPADQRIPVAVDDMRRNLIREVH